MQSKLSKEIAPFYVLEVLEKAREIEATGADVVHFEVGETDFGSPAAACEEAIAAINEGDTRYTHSLGIRELRKRHSGRLQGNRTAWTYRRTG